jgi:arylformamidase
MQIYSSFDQAELDREYSPSSCVSDIKVYLDEYRDVSRQAKENAIASESCLADVSYGSSIDERLDLYLPGASSDAPLHVFIHGGYWRALSKEESAFAAPMFQQSGSFFAALDYSLAPSVSLTEIVAQNRRAIAWLYKQAGEWGFDRDRIYLSGSSAGAHLAMMMLLTDWSQYDVPSNVVKGVCAVSGIYDLEPIRLSYVNEPLGMDSLEAENNSPMLHPIRNHCPIIFAYGDNETAEFKRQTNAYNERLIESGEITTLREVGDRNHFNVILDLANPDSWLSQQVLAQMCLD